ncbi:uncharacterized protein LOC130990916 [Salvia miltiorrhiza]|uniref:uncharacterized protein LOC130990916 n=1 Tax=Salvia miltiorrhiza TaxID=226208 RepID=UPI0025ABAB51|nr:uncharacterized protein LOC130990916 [Salvia miltiorrhiza]
MIFDAFNQFPWGAYTYNRLCYYTTKCKSKKHHKLYGPVWALHVWSLEIMPDLGNVVGNCVAEFAHPRCLKWKFRSRPATKDLRPFFEKEEQEILELVADEFEVSTMYYLSTIGVYMGAQHDEPRVYMGAQHDEAPNQDFPYGPSHDIHVQEQEQEEGGALHDIPISAHDLAATVMDTWARSSSSHEEGRRRRAREKRVRPPTTSSSSSSGDHANRRVDREYMETVVRRMDEAHEERMKRHSDALHERVKGTLKGFFEELKGFFSCKSVRATTVRSPIHRPTPAPDVRQSDDIPDEGTEEGDVPRVDNVTPSPYVPQFSQFDFGSTSYLGTDAEFPRCSNPIDQMRVYLDFMGEELASFREPSQRVETPVLPRRSTRQRFPSQVLESPYAASGEPILLSTAEMDKFTAFLNGAIAASNSVSLYA